MNRPAFNGERDKAQDCIKVLDLEGRLEFMNAGGMRVPGPAIAGLGVNFFRTPHLLVETISGERETSAILRI